METEIKTRNLLPQVIIQCPSVGLDVWKIFTLLSTITNLEEPSTYVQDSIGCFHFYVIPIFTYLSLCTSHGHQLIEPVSNLGLGNTQHLLDGHKEIGTRESY